MLSVFILKKTQMRVTQKNTEKCFVFVFGLDIKKNKEESPTKKYRKVFCLCIWFGYKKTRKMKNKQKKKKEFFDYFLWWVKKQKNKNTKKQQDKIDVCL